MNNYTFQGLMSVTWQTIEMLLISGIFIIIFGLILGICLYLTSPSYASNKKWISITHHTLSTVTNILRSLPFIILVFILIPFTKSIVGTFIGVAGAIPPLVVSAAPFFAIIVYNALSEVNKDKVEMLRSLGVKGSKIILLLLKESLSPLIRGLTITLVTLIGFIAMAGIVGAGGLGQYAQLAYQSFKTDWMWYAVLMILLIVLVIQVTGELLARKFNHKKKN